MMSIDKLPDEVKPVYKKYTISFLVLFGFLFIIISMMRFVWHNMWAVSTMILLAIATIIMIFKNAFAIKELLK